MAVKTQNLIRSSLPGWGGVFAMVTSFILLYQSQQPAYIKACIIMSVMFVVMFSLEAIICIRGNFGLISAPRQRRFKIGRILYKIVGWVITVLSIGSAYLLFPEYSGTFYTPYYQALSFAWPYLLGFFLFCIIWEDQRADEEYDDYYWIARSVLNWDIKALDKVNFKQHVLAWILKLYYLPLMFVSFVGGLGYHFQLGNFFNVYDSFYNGVFLIDTAIACIGYTFVNNLINTNIRSVDPTMLGWVVALICYQPFWSIIGRDYISYGSDWGPWLDHYPYIKIIWAVLISLCLWLYLWASIALGSRLSNLTHRGIVTCGPYAYLQHPAYIGKLLSYFFLFVPFIGKDINTVLRNCILWALLAGIYYIRAKTEERHLRSIGPEYDIYVKEVSQNWKKLFGE